MRWMEDEQQRRPNRENKRQAEANKIAAEQLLARQELEKEHQRQDIQEMDGFEGRVKNSLPQGVSIVQKSCNVELPECFRLTGRTSDVRNHVNSATSSRAILMIDLGDGVRFDLVDRTRKWVSTSGRWDSSERYERYEVFIYDAEFPLKRKLASVESNRRGNILKESMRAGLFDAHEHSAARRRIAETSS